MTDRDDKITAALKGGADEQPMTYHCATCGDHLIMRKPHTAQQCIDHLKAELARYKRQERNPVVRWDPSRSPRQPFMLATPERTSE